MPRSPGVEAVVGHSVCSSLGLEAEVNARRTMKCVQKDRRSETGGEHWGCNDFVSKRKGAREIVMVVLCTWKVRGS